MKTCGPAKGHTKNGIGTTIEEKALRDADEVDGFAIPTLFSVEYIPVLWKISNIHRRFDYF
jgi:hypothetical protein